MAEELMEYISDLEQIKARDEIIKEKIGNLIDKLNSFKISASFCYDKMNELRKNLKENTLDKNEYSDFLFIQPIKFYFSSSDNFVSLMNEQMSVLSKFIKELVERIDLIKDDLEAKKLEDIESQEITEEEPKKELEVQNGEEVLNEICEEEEEIVVNVPKYLFECEDCGNKSSNAYLGGCRKCGDNNVLVHYV